MRNTGLGRPERGRVVAEGAWSQDRYSRDLSGRVGVREQAPGSYEGGERGALRRWIRRSLAASATTKRAGDVRQVDVAPPSEFHARVHRTGVQQRSTTSVNIFPDRSCIADTENVSASSWRSHSPHCLPLTCASRASLLCGSAAGRPRSARFPRSAARCFVVFPGLRTLLDPPGGHARTAGPADNHPGERQRAAAERPEAENVSRELRAVRRGGVRRPRRWATRRRSNEPGPPRPHTTAGPRFGHRLRFVSTTDWAPRCR